MTGEEYQALAARTINFGLTDEQVMQHALHGMASEVGEIHSIHQKAYQGHPIDLKDIVNEAGDVCWFLNEYLTSRGLSFDEVMENNIAKLRLRYPDGFSTSRSMNRKI